MSNDDKTRLKEVRERGERWVKFETSDFCVNDYRDALSNEGPLAGDWNDKPHRLVYDLCNEIQHLQNLVIIGKVSSALRKGKVSPQEIQKFHEEATSSDYDNVLQTCWIILNELNGRELRVR